MDISYKLQRGVASFDFYLNQIFVGFYKKKNAFFFFKRFSGVTKEHLQNATMTLEDIHDILLGVLHRDTILLGHSLESDLFALKVQLLSFSFFLVKILLLQFKKALILFKKAIF